MKRMIPVETIDSNIANFYLSVGYLEPQKGGHHKVRSADVFRVVRRQGNVLAEIADVPDDLLPMLEQVGKMIVDVSRRKAGASKPRRWWQRLLWWRHGQDQPNLLEDRSKSQGDQRSRESL